MDPWTAKVLAAARAARAALGAPPGDSPLAVILGSGLGGFAGLLEGARAVPFAALPGFPSATVQGHEGRLLSGALEGVPVLALQGRLHGYEGHDAATVALPARVLCALGARALVATNAAGGCNLAFQPGDLMLLTDHLNLTSRNPLEGPNAAGLGPRFPDLGRAYDPRLCHAAREAARACGVVLREGVYAQFNGPSYETPAEVRMARLLGADAVGMSTVPEIIAAAHMGVPACGISCITNLAAGLSARPLSHAEVIEVARRAEGSFVQLLRGLLPRAFAAVPAREALA